MLQTQEGPVDIFGHSMGGFMALQAARHWPDKIGKLAAIETVAFGAIATGDPVDEAALAIDQNANAALVSAYDRGDREQGIAAFISLWNGPPWAKLPEPVRAGLVILGADDVTAGPVVFDNGDFVLVRQVQSDQSPFQNAIYGQRFDDAGGTVGLEFVIEDAANNAFFDPAVAVLTDDKMIVVFSATNLDNPGDFDHGVFGQLFAAAGSVIGVPQQLNICERFSQEAPTVAATDDGGFVVAYQSDFNDDFGYTPSLGVYVQKFDTTGSAVTGEILVNEIVDNSQHTPDVVGLPGGGFTVTYVDNNGTDSSSSGVFAQTFDTNGNRIDGRVLINQETLSGQDSPAVASLGGENYVTAYRSDTNAPSGDGSGSGIFHRIAGDPADFSVGGDPIVDGVNAVVNYVENTESLSEQINPAVTALADGGFFVVWQSFSSSGSADGSAYGIFARIIAPDGSAITDEFRINDQRLNSQSNPNVTALDSGGFVITWDDNNATDGSGTGVFAQQYDGNGNRLDSQFQPVVTELPNGGFAIAWTSVTSSIAGDGSGNGVFY